MSAVDAAAIAVRLAEVRAGIERAAAQAGREPGAARLVAVSKRQPAAAVAAAWEAGQRDFGENYAQELRDKARELAGLDGIRWHHIGPLQRNKVKYVVGTAALVHGVDRVELVEALARQAASLGVRQRCLAQVNIGAEPQKAGCALEELPRLVDAFRSSDSLALEGLMCIPPDTDRPEATRPYFRRLAELAAAEHRRTGLALPELSMGMSADYAVAIAEGATLVRVGTAIFGSRTLP